MPPAPYFLTLPSLPNLPHEESLYRSTAAVEYGSKFPPGLQIMKTVLTSHFIYQTKILTLPVKFVFIHLCSINKINSAKTKVWQLQVLLEIKGQVLFIFISTILDLINKL